MIIHLEPDIPGYEVLLRESVPRQVYKKSGVPEEVKASRALEKEKGVSGSQGEKDKRFFLHPFVLVNITIYLARGHVSP